MTTKNWWTVTELARELRMTDDKTRALIQEGSLIAVNVARRGCTRPRFLVSNSAVEEFLSRRRTAGRAEAVC
jgi:excisionase family DNA binding protein